MKLYTINATPVREAASKDKNDQMCAKFPQEIADILNEYDIDGFTIYEVKGYWEGLAERSFKIEIATSLDYFIMSEVCNHIRDEYSQKAVMLTKPDNTVELI